MRRSCRILTLLLALAFGFGLTVQAAQAAGMSAPMTADQPMGDDCGSCGCAGCGDDGAMAMLAGSCFGVCSGPVASVLPLGHAVLPTAVAAPIEVGAACITAATAPEPYPPKSSIAA